MKEKKHSNSTEHLYKIFIYVVLILLAVIIIVPVAWVFMASIKQNKEFYGNPWTLPEGFYFQNFIDAWNMLVALFILWSGWSAAKDTISPLLGEPASEELVQSISRLILSHEKILGIHDLMVHDYGPGQCFASVHAEMDSREDPLLCHDVLDDIERDALRELRVHLVIHYDPIVTDDAELNHMRTFVQETIRAIDPELTLHDFRMVRGAQHTNLIFDLVIPYSLVGKQAELKHRIDARVQQEDRKYYTVITFDEPVCRS